MTKNSDRNSDLLYPGGPCGRSAHRLHYPHTHKPMNGATRTGEVVVVVVVIPVLPTTEKCTGKIFLQSISGGREKRGGEKFLKGKTHDGGAAEERRRGETGGDQKRKGAKRFLIFLLIMFPYILLYYVMFFYRLCYLNLSLSYLYTLYTLFFIY